MPQDIKSAVLEALQELGRVLMLAVIPVIISGLDTGRVEWKTVGVVGAIAVLRFIDKALHEWGKLTEDESLTRGLTGF